MIFNDKLKKYLPYLPTYPHYKMNVFSGTNSKEELFCALKNLIFKYKSNNKLVDTYQKEFGTLINNQKIYSFASGRMGLYAILKSLNLEQENEVILPSYTCVVVPNAIIYNQLKPVYCDINLKDFNIDVSKVEALITPKTKVLYAQHTFGQMCDIEKIMQIAKKYNLIVIEDVALALGANINNQYAGTFGDFGFFSTDRSKITNTGLGGIVSVNKKKYIPQFEYIYAGVPFLPKYVTKKILWTFIINLIVLNPRVYWIGKFINIVMEKLGVLFYFSDENRLQKPDNLEYKYPSKLSPEIAEIGILQMQKIDLNLVNRRKHAQYYNSILKIYSNEYMQSLNNVFLRYSFLVRNRAYWEDRFSSKIDLSIWFKSIAAGKVDKFEEIYYKNGTNKNSEYAVKYIFNLPTHNNIDPKRLKKLLVELKESGDIIILKDEIK